MPSTTTALVIEKAVFHAYFIYDISDTINIERLKELEGDKFKQKKLSLRAEASPSSIEFSVPPLVASWNSVTVEGLQASVAIKLYDYGIVSIRLSFSFSGAWAEFARTSRLLRQSEELTESAAVILKELTQLISAAINKPHAPLVEDYFIFELCKLQPQVESTVLLNEYRSELASLLLGESKPLSRLEQDEALRIHFSYFDSDLVIVQWDASIVMDNEDGAEAVESILEFANTQLVEFRSYDLRLDSKLDEIYGWNLTRRQPHAFFGRKDSAQRTELLRSLLVDIRELSDRASNALKIIGDAYYVRVYRGITSRLGLSDWQHQVESKLESVGEVYRFATDQAQHASSEFLELVIIVLILIEILLSLIH